MVFDSANMQHNLSSWAAFLLSLTPVEDTMWPLSVSCQGRRNIRVEWLNPTAPFDSALVRRVHLNGTCLYGNRTDL